MDAIRTKRQPRQHLAPEPILRLHNVQHPTDVSGFASVRGLPARDPPSHACACTTLSASAKTTAAHPHRRIQTACPPARPTQITRGFCGRRCPRARVAHLRRCEGCAAVAYFLEGSHGPVVNVGSRRHRRQGTQGARLVARPSPGAEAGPAVVLIVVTAHRRLVEQQQRERHRRPPAPWQPHLRRPLQRETNQPQQDGVYWASCFCSFQECLGAWAGRLAVWPTLPVRFSGFPVFRPLGSSPCSSLFPYASEADGPVDRRMWWH